MKTFTVIGLIFSFFFGSLRYGFTPTIVFDAAAPLGPVSSRASGYLYGLAEENVPDALMAASVDIASVSQKVAEGLQHPIGDVDHVAGSLGTCDYITVYLQDSFSTWYYANDEIFDARRAGTYDWREFLRDEFYPRVREKVDLLRDKPYADRLVYCPYNECDNGVWFGTWQEEGQYAAFDEAGRDAFFEAWADTFALIRSLDPSARLGGPGYCDYSVVKEEEFLRFCRDNGCLPDVMIWHELGDLSSEQWNLHVAEYRALEESLGIEELPIVVTEYGTMQECGNPAALLPYVRQIEETGVYGNIAYWRLADNLCDVSADGVSPNSCWWLYRWYADMEGQLLAKDVRDLFHADFGKAVREARPLRNKHFNGFASLSDGGDRIDALAGGADYAGQIRLKNLGSTKLGGRVRVTVEAVTFEGLSGKVFAPAVLRCYETSARCGSLTVKLGKTDGNAVFHVKVEPASDAPLTAVSALPERFEFERGELLGEAYTYDSAYATTGEIAGMVGGMERPGDGVRLPFSVPADGEYVLKLVCGKANDGPTPDDRISAVANYSLDGEPGEITLPNTVRSEFTTSLCINAELKKGSHTLEFTHCEGTFVLDSLLVSPAREAGEIALLREAEKCGDGVTAYIAVAPETGRYSAETDAAFIRVNGARCGSETVFLRQGLNLVELGGENAACSLTATGEAPDAFCLSAEELTPTGGAEVIDGALTGISSEGGAAEFTFDAPAAGDYVVTLYYSNNAEGGYHAYNVDLIERYFTVSAAGQTKRVWCRNTLSDENIGEVSFTLSLPEGETAISLFNDGEVRFDGRENGTPRLYRLTVNPA